MWGWVGREVGHEGMAVPSACSQQDQSPLPHSRLFLSTSQASLASAAPDLKREMYRDFCRELAAKTARLIAHWDAVGFVHAVLNTDNFSLAGVAIDYGPFAFLDRYDPSFVASGSDDTGRYAFRQQVKAGAYAMHQLATALQPVVGAMDVARVFNEEYMRHRHALFLRKLGLTDSALAREVRSACAGCLGRDKVGRPRCCPRRVSL